jgi:hypothetical protein
MKTRSSLVAVSVVWVGLLALCGCSTSGTTPACTPPDFLDCLQLPDGGLPEAGQDADAAGLADADAAGLADADAASEPEVAPSNDGAPEAAAAEGGQDDGSATDAGDGATE